MILIVVNGRKDEFGYNLLKRGALGLNCEPDVLTDPDDELRFDYNTSDDCPILLAPGERLPKSGWVASPASTSCQYFSRLSNATIFSARE